MLPGTVARGDARPVFAQGIYRPRLSLYTLTMRAFRSYLVAAVILIAGLTFVPAARADYEAGMKSYRAGDYVTALNEWLPLAKAGDTDSQAGLGMLYHFGHGVEQNFENSMNWLLKAARKGQPKALYFIGSAYHRGDGVKKGFKKAECWYLLSAERGYGRAQYNLWGLYLQLEHTKKAHYWRDRSLVQGFPSSLFAIGRTMVEHGDSEEKTSGYKLLHIAANKGHSKSIEFLSEKAENADINTRQQLSDGRNRAKNWVDRSQEISTSDINPPNKCLP